MSPWMKWTRTTPSSSLIMYSMLSRLITLSPTRSNLLMVHLLPPKSRAETPRRIPRPGRLECHDCRDIHPGGALTGGSCISYRGGLCASFASAATAAVSSFPLFAVLVYVADEYPAVVAGVGALKARVVSLYGVVLLLDRWVRVGCARLCGVHWGPFPLGRVPGCAATCGAIPFSATKSYHY